MTIVSSSALVAALAGCYVVPLDPKTGQPYPSQAAQVVHAPAPVVVVQPSAAATHLASPTAYTVRLYPTNETARAVGILQATVLDSSIASPMRGSFTVNYSGQALQGEATRVDRNYPGFGNIMQSVQGGYNWSQVAGQRGIANAAGNNISLRCEYIFTSPTQGTGACVGGDGAKFQAHFGG